MSQKQTLSPRWLNLRSRLARYLTADLFNRLRALPDDFGPAGDDAAANIAGELQTAVRDLESLHRVLVNYTPRYLLNLDPEPGQPHGELIEGSFIFADVTGFTALTELLARQGKARGRETMNQIMNGLFSSLLDPLIASGGDLLFFVGDAVLAYFPQQPQGDDVLQAIRAALRMQRAIVPFARLETEFGPSSLTISIGLEHGPAYAGVVGTNTRMELLISGPATGGATRAEKKAESGQVRLGPQAQAIAMNHFTLAESVVIDDLGDDLGDFEISPPVRKPGRSVLFSTEPGEILNVVEASLQRIERLGPFVPEDMLAHLVNSEGRRQLRSEFRPVATQFIYISGLEELALARGPEFATDVFERFFIRAQEIVTRHEGVISQIDAFNDNFILLNTFGVPKMHEGTKRSAVSAALQLARALAQVNRHFELDTPLQMSSGITHGLTFNGEIGAKYRRESVIAGPAVNRAARLMVEAKSGQVILDADIWAGVQHAFAGEQLPSVRLKGIEGEVVIVNVRQVRLGTRLRPLERPLVGRKPEQAWLAQALAGLLHPASPRGSAWLVSGETGLGKSSLLADLADTARQRGVEIFIGRCQPHGKHIPLFPWIDLLTGWLDVDENADQERLVTRLTQALASLGLVSSQPALIDLLSLPEPKHPIGVGQTGSANEAELALSRLNNKLEQRETNNAVPQAARPSGLQALLQQRVNQTEYKGDSMWQRLEERVDSARVVSRLIKKLVERQPLLIIVEDLHWADPNSLALLKELAAEASGLALMVVATDHTPPDKQAAFASLPLAPLPEIAITQVAQRALHARRLDAPLSEWIGRQAGGNPLFAEELCQALLRADAVLLDRSTGEARWTKYVPDLPLSLHQLLLARFDKLGQAGQDILIRAAVFGQSFEYDGLLKLCHGYMGETQVRAALEGAIETSFLTAPEEIVYRFHHPLMQEAIYSTLSFSQRQNWHAQIGDWLVERQQAPDEALELIAYHYLRGKNIDKAAHFGRRAGDRARERGIYAGALEFYQQVLAMADAPVDERAQATEGQADVLALQGDYAAANRAYTLAAELGSPTALDKQANLSGEME